jgi:hypothetical protein
LSSAAASAAPAWTWVDADGRRHFSDRPVPGATLIELPDGGPSAPATRTTASTTTRIPQPPAEAPAPAVGYTRFDVLSPSNEQTLWNIGGTLSMQVAVEPALQPSHVLDVIMDGERVELGARGAQLTIPEVYRGLHTLQAVIVDSVSGSEILRSQPVTIMVQQTSILNPNNPNARRGN